MSAGVDMALMYAFAIGAIAAFVALYFLPALIVRNRQHANAIKRLNLYLGWTGVGWIAAFLWAIMSPKKETVAVTKNCPLCETEKHIGQKTEMLYGHLVCRKCYVAFANRRQLAFAIDAILWEVGGALVVFVGRFVLAIGGASDPQIEGAARMMQWVLWPTFFLKDGFSRGRSPGKAMMGLQVVHETSDEPTGFWVSFKRNLPLAIPFMPLVVAAQLYKGHRWGDGWSESRVIWEKCREKVPFAISRASP